MRGDLEFGILMDSALLNPVVRRLISMILGLALGFATLIGSFTVAQRATPVPVACDPPTRPVTFIADLLKLPEPEITPTPIAAVPEGAELTDPAARSEATRLVEQLILCVNQGELLRSFSLYDDGYLRRIIDPAGVMTAEVAVEIAKSFATPKPVDADKVTVLDEVLSVRQLPDGDIVVVFATHKGELDEGDQPQVDLLVLRTVGSQLRIVDGLVDLDRDSIATPAP
jgi:hypothetical protein